MSEPGELVSWPSKLRLTEIRQRGTGGLNPAKALEARERLVGSIYDATWQQNASCVNPTLSVFVDDTFIYCKLMAVQEEPWRAATWRNQSFDAMKFRRCVEEAVQRGLDHYKRKTHDKAVIVVDNSIRIVPLDSMGDFKPRRV